MSYGTPYGEVLAPRRKRGRIRIVLGVLGVLLSVIGLLRMSLVAALVAAVLAPLTAAPVSLHGSSGTFATVPRADHYVYVPSAEAGSVTCSAAGTGGVIWEPEPMGISAAVVGTDYSQIGRITVPGPQAVTVTCDRASDVAVVTLGMTGTAGTFVTLGVISLLLLIWGIIALRRSQRPPERGGSMQVSGW